MMNCLNNCLNNFREGFKSQNENERKEVDKMLGLGKLACVAGGIAAAACAAFSILSVTFAGLVFGIPLVFSAIALHDIYHLCDLLEKKNKGDVYIYTDRFFQYPDQDRDQDRDQDKENSKCYKRMLVLNSALVDFCVNKILGENS